MQQVAFHITTDIAITQSPVINKIKTDDSEILV